MAMKITTDDQIFKIHADFCGALANEKRLKIMWLLAQGERSVGDIAQEIGITIANTSQHLRVQRDKGAVLEEKKGQNVIYRISNSKFVKGCRLIREGIIETQRIRSKLFFPEQVLVKLSKSE
jgi:DNA-binding transcriptional ArsR family regulator